MSGTSPKPKVLGRGALTAYLLIGVAALAFDVAADRSFGTLMLSVLPTSVIAVACLLAAPWLSEDRAAALRNWLVGTLIVLIISLGFASLGAEQAKTGELIFTYAALLMALPASLVLPLAMTWVAPLVANSVASRIVFAWAVCLVVGWIESQALSWLSARLRRR